MSYFLISVSNRTNLDLCLKHALAGFTNSINGLWTFSEIQKEDFISFLYGARVFNLYRVKDKVAFKNADKLPPWPPVTFRMSGKTYYFPFRLILEPIRQFEESMVKPEFSYVAENLLLRGGYRKTHFQADQTTLQSVSQMGILYSQETEPLPTNTKTFTPKFTWDKTKVFNPEIFKFQEFILQSLLRLFMSDNIKFKNILDSINQNGLKAEDFEALGEKALPQGHIDILIKESTPRGLSRKLIVEVKSSTVNEQHIKQLLGYMNELGSECLAGILIGKKFSKKALKMSQDKKIIQFVYRLEEISKNETYSFDELQQKIRLDKID